MRAEVDARNELDTVAYQVRRTLDENAGTVPEHERARADLLLNDARTALEEQADIDRLRALTGELPILAVVPHLFGTTAFAETGPLQALYVMAHEALLPSIYKGVPFLAISESTRDDLVARGIEREQVSVVHCGLDHVRYQKTAEKAERPMRYR